MREKAFQTGAAVLRVEAMADKRIMRREASRGASFSLCPSLSIATSLSHPYGLANPRQLSSEVSFHVCVYGRIYARWSFNCFVFGSSWHLIF